MSKEKMAENDGFVLFLKIKGKLHQVPLTANCGENTITGENIVMFSHQGKLPVMESEFCMFETENSED